MATKKRRRSFLPDASRRRSASNLGFYTPFAGLDQLLAEARDHIPAKERSTRSEEESHQGRAKGEASSEDAFFVEAMADVVPLSDDQRGRVPPRTPNPTFPRFGVQEDWEVLTHLSDLVSGHEPLKLLFTDEYIDGAVKGLDPRILHRLRNGDFSYQDYLDLHGFTREEAHVEVVRFLTRHHGLGHRCVLIVSGRGLNSKDGEPVLKKYLVRWLTRSPLRQMVLAFANARGCDGGTGAFYVLLRKGRGRGPVQTPAQ